MDNNDNVKLNSEEITILYSELEEWVLDKNSISISKNFVFNDFVEAFSWMTAISVAAEEINHHPEWKNVYNKVEVLLSTHDVQGLTRKDFVLANLMDKEFKK
jgi:4a-hydroxytetrahydrobiopterin dehydratase